MVPALLHLLHDFPQTAWHEPETERWHRWCTALAGYTPPPVSLQVRNLDRKWEIVSAYQKCVRRGLVKRAQWLVGGAVGQDRTWWEYLWRRVCTTACEDVGYGDVELMNFVIAASSIWTPSKPAGDQYAVLCFVTGLMCATKKSRIFCSLSIIENQLKELPFSPAGDWERYVVALLKSKDGYPADSVKAEWARKNDWRGEQMLRYQYFSAGVEWLAAEVNSVTSADLEPGTILGGLPDFAYDMHTRVGKNMLVRVTGHPKVKAFYSEHVLADGCSRVEPLGWALFYVEGGRIQQECRDSRLTALEQRIVAQKFGWSPEVFAQFKELVQSLLQDATVTSLRRKVLATMPY